MKPGETICDESDERIEEDYYLFMFFIHGVQYRLFFSLMYLNTSELCNYTNFMLMLNAFIWNLSVSFVELYIKFKLEM